VQQSGFSGSCELLQEGKFIQGHFCLDKVDGALPMNKDPMKYLHQSIKKFVSTVLPGKHVHEKNITCNNSLIYWNAV
jgi:hypothetical protein